MKGRSAPEEVHGGTVVRSEPGAEAGGSQAPPRRAAQLVVGGQPEFVAVATGLFEVVADDLVQLDELAPALIQPGCEALVKLSPRRFRQGLVRGVTDQDVVESERSLVRKCGLGRLDELLVHQDQERAPHVVSRLRRRELGHGTAMEDLPLDRPTLDHGTLLRSEPLEASSK